MIVVGGVHARVSGGGSFLARRPPSFLRNVSFTWDRGVLAVLGGPFDGTKALLEVLAGTTKAQAGSVTVDGVLPANARSSIAYVPLDATLPDSLRVAEICELAASVRGEPAASAEKRLAPLGLEGLAPRLGSALTPGEARAVLLSLALSSSAKVILVEEPLAGFDSSVPARIVDALRERAKAGCAIVVTTASVRDATRLGDQLGLLTQGIYTHLAPSLAHVGPAGARLRVVLGQRAEANAAAPFVAALSEDRAVGAIETTTFGTGAEGQGPISVVLGGPNLLELARAVATAAARTNAPIEAVESAVMPLDAIRAALVVPRQAPAAVRPPPPPASMQPSVPPPVPGAAAPASLPPASHAPAASVPPPGSMPPPSGGAA